VTQNKCDVCGAIFIGEEGILHHPLGTAACVPCIEGLNLRMHELADAVDDQDLGRILLGLPGMLRILTQSMVDSGLSRHPSVLTRKTRLKQLLSGALVEQNG
jgi:hypothetical protein